MTGKSLDVRITPASDSGVIERLLDDYLDELVGSARLAYPGLSCYWSQADRHPYLILAHGQHAGFALVRDVDHGSIHELAEFYIMPGLVHTVTWTS